MKIAVLGAGSWGTALALRLAKNNNEVFLWGHREEHIRNLGKDRENKKYLPEIKFPENLVPIIDLEMAVKYSSLVLVVVPSGSFSPLLEQIKPFLENRPLMWAIKGFEQGTGRLLSEVFEEKLKNHSHALLAGPSFAKEVARGLPTAVSIVSKANAEFFAKPFHGSNFVCYTSNDLIGAQIGGAVKNVIAIAAGISDGLGGGANARAALITRGLHEMTRLALKMGAEDRTLAGLTGLGDLVLTCTDNQSRNRRFGLLLGQGKSPEEAKNEIAQVVEGEGAAFETWNLAQKYQVRMPIVEHIHKLLAQEINLKELFNSLSNRVLKQENF